jgi:hypothetical protein
MEKLQWWCLHCERSVHTPARVVHGSGDEYTCPWCGAGEHDLWDWGQVREINAKYPALSLDGAEYPLYGPSRVELPQRSE